MIVVSDTSPVRALIAINKVEILQKLFSQVFIPKAVETELLRIESLKKEIALFLSRQWVIVKNVNHDKEYESIRIVLDEGESEAIALAISLHADLLLIDESKGRQIAKEKALKPLGLIGVLLKAKKENHLSLIKPELDKLMNEHGFWIDEELYSVVLKAAGE